MGKTVSVTRPHNTSREAAMEKLKSLGQDAATKYGVSVQPTGTGANVDGRGISGTCRIDDRNITISLELPLLLRAISGKIEQGINKSIDQHFG
ncbi:MAG: polyhydroxyalkanoic acid system family protein [bacterium]